MSFSEGDIVVLRSGGPTMIVEDLGNALNTVCCVWFDEREVRRDTFHPLALALHNGEEI